MTPALDSAPELPFDEALYEPLSGAQPMGPPCEDWQISLLEMEFPAENEKLDDKFPRPRNFYDRREKAFELLEKSRDLRLYVRLAEAHSQLEGPRALHGALDLVLAVTRKYWDEIHPGPPQDNKARLARLRALGPLRDRKLVTAFDSHPVFDAGGFEGKITLRHFYLATKRYMKNEGRRPPQKNEEAYDLEKLQELVVKAEAQDSIEATLTALRHSGELLRELQEFLVAIPGYDNVSFRAVFDELDHYVASLAPFSAGAKSGDGAATREGGDQAGLSDASAEPEPKAATALTSRGEAQALLNQVIRYYATEERSSPIPLALLKIRGLSDGSFAEWLSEVADDGFEKAALSLANITKASLDELPTDETEAETPSEVPAAMVALDDALKALESNEAAATAAAAEIDRLKRAVEQARSDFEAAYRAGARPASPIRDRAEVRGALKRLSAYYGKAEPSSPASVCFERLIHLVDRPFMDIVREIAPKGGPAMLRLAPAEGSKGGE